MQLIASNVNSTTRTHLNNALRDAQNICPRAKVGTILNDTNLLYPHHRIHQSVPVDIYHNPFHENNIIQSVIFLNFETSLILHPFCTSLSPILPFSNIKRGKGLLFVFYFGSRKLELFNEFSILVHILVFSRL